MDIILTGTTATALAAKQASRTVPIVMLGSGFPVEAGLAASLGRPGGNVTGLSVYALIQINGGLDLKYTGRHADRAGRALHLAKRGLDLFFCEGRRNVVPQDRKAPEGWHQLFE